MKRLFAAFILIMLVSVPAFALSNAEYKKMMKNPKFAAADKKLNTAYSKAKKAIKRKEGLEHLTELQRQWVEEGRDEEAARLIENEEYSNKIDAYIAVTSSRAEAFEGMVELINNEGDYYNSKGVHLEITWQNPLKWRLFVFLDYNDEDWLGEGGAFGDEGEEFYGNADSSTVATLTMIDEDTVKVETNDDFKNIVGFNAEGIYKRK